MLERIIDGIVENWMIVGISLLMLVGGTIAAYRKHGLKRVLLGKRHDHRELIYRSEYGDILWGETLKSWKIILTGGMSLLALFLLVMLLALSFIYQHDISATRANDELLCQEFGTTLPTDEQLIDYAERNDLNFSDIIITETDDGRGTGNTGSG